MSARRGEQAMATTWNLRWKQGRPWGRMGRRRWPERPRHRGRRGAHRHPGRRRHRRAPAPRRAAESRRPGVPGGDRADPAGRLAWPAAADRCWRHGRGGGGKRAGVGPFVRCGVALPAVYIVAFGIAARVGWPRAAVGLAPALCAADVVAEGYYNPNIGWSGIALVLPLLLAFIVLGYLVSGRGPEPDGQGAAGKVGPAARGSSASRLPGSRSWPTAPSCRRTSRARSAGFSVIADTAAAGLSSAANPQADPAEATEEATRALATDDRARRPGGARAAPGGSRRATAACRGPGGTPRAAAHPRPAAGPSPRPPCGPGQADRRRAAAMTALPAALELSGYRIVEHLVQALADEPSAVIEVRLGYHPEALDLDVTGTTSPGATDLVAVLAETARQRAVLHGGTVDGRIADGVCSVTAQLPLVSRYA